MRYLLPIAFTLALSTPSVYAETCTDKWKYRIVNLDDPQSLIKRAKKKTDAVKALKNALNQFGDNGWQLVSNHSVVEYEEFTNLALEPAEAGAKLPSGDWVYRLDPTIALFQRRTTTCQ